jgi:SAM-dependent methyltransferase
LAVLQADYGHPRQSGQSFTKRDVLEGKLRVHRSIYRSEWIQYRGDGRLLDVGCGSGDFLLRMSRRGWKVEGVDIGQEHAARLSAKLGHPVHAGTLHDASLPTKTYDLITFWQVLEHLHDPIATLQAARQLLTGVGTVVASVPNFDSFSRRVFASHWVGLDTPRHLIHFTRETLSDVFHRAGFAVVRTQQISMDGWIRRSARASRDSHFWQTLQWKPLAKTAATASRCLGFADNLLVEARPLECSARIPSPTTCSPHRQSA